MLANLETELQQLANPQKAKELSRFFKTGKGEYGEGDVFLGITVPQQRKIAKKYKTLSLAEIETLLNSKIHEYRFTALVILCERFSKADRQTQTKIFQFYLARSDRVNNWDLVDTSAYKIVGSFLYEKNCSVLYDLARSQNLWQQRISIIATYYFIKRDRFVETLELSKVLLNHPHDLIHKAVGWMLREVGKRDEATEKAFLDKYAAQMPRTMLRYAIEKFPPEERKAYLQQKF
ncbi:MAG: DNA alkylation repair protein [Cyanobacteria bacterium SBLK]|nr:DNA alkylation repair protein [Cyanobacteria bacterium SBLK]